MARENPTIREFNHHYPIEVATLGSAGGCELEDAASRVHLVERYLP